MVKEKGLKEFLEEEEVLKRKVTYEEFNSATYGFDNSSIEEVYKCYRKFIEKN